MGRTPPRVTPLPGYQPTIDGPKIPPGTQREEALVIEAEWDERQRVKAAVAAAEAEEQRHRRFWRRLWNFFVWRERLWGSR